MTNKTQPTHPHLSDEQKAEAALRQVLDVVREYLPPNGGVVEPAMSRIIAIVDPWPVDDLPGMWERADITGGETDTPPAAAEAPAISKALLMQVNHAFGELAMAYPNAYKLAKVQAADAAVLEAIAAQPKADSIVNAGSVPIAWALRWPGDQRINLSTVFDTEQEAKDYATRCTNGPSVVPLAEIAPKADSTEAKAMQFKKGLCEQCGKLTIFQTCTECLAAPSPVNPASAQAGEVSDVDRFAAFGTGPRRFTVYANPRTDIRAEAEQWVANWKHNYGNEATAWMIEQALEDFTHKIDGGLRAAVRQMTAALSRKEWAEHCSADSDATALECEITTLMGAALALRPKAQPLTPADKKLIGWRSADYTMETADPQMAKNWSGNIEVLPIFEGDPNTKLGIASPTKGEGNG